MLQGVAHAVVGELTLDGVAGTTHAGPVGAAALNHEAGNDTVEDQTVIKALLHQTDEVVHRIGGDRGVQLRLDHTAVFHLDGHNGIAHSRTSLSLGQQAHAVLTEILEQQYAVFLVILEPVSYTHLDVYKRQAKALGIA